MLEIYAQCFSFHAAELEGMLKKKHCVCAERAAKYIHGLSCDGINVNKVSDWPLRIFSRPFC